MQELLQAAFAPINLIPTFLLLFVLGYWLIVLVGMVDLDALDVDVDVDLDADADVGTSEGSLLWLNHALAFFNLGEVPLMVFLTFLALPLWAGSVLANHYFGNDSFLLSLGLLVPLLIAGLFVAKFLTWPLTRVFAHLDREENTSVIGKVCQTLSAVDQRSGHAVVEGTGAPIKLMVRTPEGVRLPKGATALVIDYLQDHKRYLIDPY
ncbi:MAG: hypothetical protein WBA12_02830 [Catalinimonas sp.]